MMDGGLACGALQGSEEHTSCLCDVFELRLRSVWSAGAEELTVCDPQESSTDCEGEAFAFLGHSVQVS